MSGCRQRTEGCQWLHVEHVFSHESLSALFTYNSLLLLTSALCLKYNSNKELDRNHTAAATFRFSRNVLQPVFPTSLFQANNCIHSRKINIIFHLVTTNFDLWPDRFKVNYHPKYLGQKSFRPKLIVWTHTHTHQTDCLPGPLRPMSHLWFYRATLSRNFIARQNRKCDMVCRATSQQLRNFFSKWTSTLFCAILSR